MLAVALDVNPVLDTVVLVDLVDGTEVEEGVLVLLRRILRELLMGILELSVKLLEPVKLVPSAELTGVIKDIELTSDNPVDRPLPPEVLPLPPKVPPFPPIVPTVVASRPPGRPLGLPMTSVSGIKPCLPFLTGNK